MEQEHRRLLSEMKRRRLWYLRKTPQDYIIEDLMLKHRCTQEKAEQIYLKQLEKNKLIRVERQSPEQERANNNTSRAGAGSQRSKDEGGNLLGIKHIYENIIHAASPSRAGSRADSRSGGRLLSTVSHLEPGREIIQPVNVMRQPQSPLNAKYVGEPDYAERDRLSPHDPRGRRGRN